jgi:16S rRNA (adenine1518-N6/adenine1519-N6)-dimethyltransferase
MARFERVIAQAFSMRRKTLRNSLRKLVDASTMETAGIDPGARPETLSLEQFAALSELINE